MPKSTKRLLGRNQQSLIIQKWDISNHNVYVCAIIKSVSNYLLPISISGNNVLLSMIDEDIKLLLIVDLCHLLNIK